MEQPISTESPSTLNANGRLRQGNQKLPPQDHHFHTQQTGKPHIYKHSSSKKNAEFWLENAGLANIQSMIGDWAPRIDLQPQSQSELCEPRGVPRVFIDTCMRWGLNEDEQLTLLGYPPRDSTGRLVLQGRVRALTRDARDRAGYVIAISVGLAILYGENMAAENRWLRRGRTALDGKSPLDRMLEGDMNALIMVNGMVERERGL